MTYSEFKGHGPIKWDRPCYKCRSHFCGMSCKEEPAYEVADYLPLLSIDGVNLSGAVIDQIMAWGRKCAVQAREREPLTEWLPIETAPKDGTAVLVMRDIWPGSKTGRAEKCVGHNTYVAAWWADEGNSGEWVCYMDRIEEPICPIKPTHWMPLPPPPIEAAHGKLWEKNKC